MKHNSYYPTNVGSQIIWLGNFNLKLPTVSLSLGLNTDQLKAGLADSGWLLFILETWLPAVRAWNLACTNAANDAQTGDGTKPIVLPTFTPPVPPTGLEAAKTGALLRLFALVQIIKDSGKCTPAIAADLQIVGSAQPGPGPHHHPARHLRLHPRRAGHRQMGLGRLRRVSGRLRNLGGPRRWQGLCAPDH